MGTASWSLRVTSRLAGSVGLPPCLSSCTSSTSSSLALQLYRQRTQPRDRKEDWHSASDDGDQLVHVPNCVLVPNAWHFSCEGRGIHPAGLLRFRHYFQVRSRHRYLPDLLREVQQAVSLAMNVCRKRRGWHHFADFSSRTDTL